MKMLKKKKSVIYEEGNYSSSSVIMAPSVKESPPEAFPQTPSCSKDSSLMVPHCEMFVYLHLFLFILR